MIKKVYLKYCILGILVATSLASCKDPKPSVKTLIKPPGWYSNGLRTASFQLKKGALAYAPTKKLPRSVKNDSIELVEPENWTSGFYPGNLWLMYGLSKNEEFKSWAEQYSQLLDGQQYETFTHDLGFMMYCSLGTGLRFANNDSYQKDLVTAANSLKSRYNPKIGVIRSWDFGEWQYPVIIDNMINLELLFWASKITKDKSYFDIAVKHAETTIENHFRNDYSTFHVVEYDTITTRPISKGTFQGYSDSSSWSRGQAWALYGYTMAYRETGEKKFLEQAEKVANFIVSNLKKNEDMVPFWDFDSPDIPNTARDASAGAVMASAFLELQKHTQNSLYTEYAEELLQILSSEKYLAKKGKNKFYILKHSTGSYPHNSEIDVPLVYADYYYLEAMERYAKIKNFNLEQVFN